MKMKDIKQSGVKLSLGIPCGKRQDKPGNTQFLQF